VREIDAQAQEFMARGTQINAEATANAGHEVGNRCLGNASHDRSPCV
jgi:hypothetical protein